MRPPRPPVRCPDRSALKGLLFGLAALACLPAVPASAGITYDLVAVGNPGNANDTTGYGAVSYLYEIGKYDVTIGQYTAFLNAVATTDTYSLYNTSMGTDRNSRGISRSGTSGSYVYSEIGPDGIVNGQSAANRPITFVSWFDSARFANWMANGQPTGAQTSATTENGAYNLNGSTSGNAVAKNTTNPNTGIVPAMWIPTENEWYKAAYYQPIANGGPTDEYWAYATQSDLTPGNVIGNGANQANYNNGVYSVTQSSSYSSNQNYLTDVGAFTNSSSYYGTFDQSGNVFEWNDFDGTAGPNRGLRGGSWLITASSLSSSYRPTLVPSTEYGTLGFRLAAVPEPSTVAMALAGLGCGGWQMFRRRRPR